MTGTVQFCTFYLDQSLFGLDVLKVQEVIQRQEMTPMPLAPSMVLGLMNLRGTIVSCIDLRRRFGLPDPAADVDRINVVTQTGGGLASFEVDRIGDVVEVDAARFEPVPDTVRGEASKLIDGVYKLEHALLLVLNAERVLDFEDCR